jgi:hypothetical protein
MTPEDRFDAVAAEVSIVEDVSAAAGGRRSGAPALRRYGLIVATLSAGCLVVKLPRERVDELIELGLGKRFAPPAGAPMLQWFVLTADVPWRDLVTEAIGHARRG